MTRSERFRVLKYGIYGLVMLMSFVLTGARGLTPQLWGAVTDPMPFLVAAIAMYEGPYVGGCFGFAAGMLVSLHSLAVEGLSALYLGLFGLLFGLLAQVYLRQLLVSAYFGGVLCILFQGVVRYGFYQRLVYDIPLVAGGKMLAGELLLALIPGLILCSLIHWLYRRFEVTQS